MKAARQARPPVAAKASVYPALEGVSPDTLFGAFLDALADRLADRLVSRIAPDPATRWACAKDNPIGSARAFLDAGRRGDFETCKRGREVVARWADVVAYIEGRECKRKPRPRPAAPLDPAARRRAQLVAAGVLPGDAA